MDKFNKLKQLITDAEADFSGFYEKGNKAAGTRVRNLMQELKVLAQDVRKEVMAKKSEAK